MIQYLLIFVIVPFIQMIGFHFQIRNNSFRSVLKNIKIILWYPYCLFLLTNMAQTAEKEQVGKARLSHHILQLKIKFIIIQNIPQMSVILGKYKNKRKLGKGAYGDVLLVQDPNGKEIALKMISKKMLQKQEFLQEYLQGQKQVMMSVKNRFVMELYAYEEDQNYKYFVCEYCDGGDLLNYQSKQPNKVFDLKTATKILSEVIQGLEVLHSKGYLHRDIKPQNILLKKQANKNQFVCKLADFGFAKKCEKADGTVLGTQAYMSPEIYSNEKYSYEVDMWAFGVVFYFMLNMQLPFRINPHAQIQQKRKDLLKQASTFTYTESVKKGKKKLMQNCTQQVNDLFSKMFTVSPEERITFIQIRAHPLFKQYFPVIQNQSKILYKKKKAKLDRYNSFVQARMSVIVKKPVTQHKPLQQITETDNALPQPSFPKVNTNEQKAQLDAVLDRILFLDQMADSLRVLYGEILSQPQLQAFRYDLIRYQIILLRDLKDSLNVQALNERYPNLKWKQFAKTKQFSAFKNSVKQNIDKAQLIFSQSEYQCENVMNLIKTKNPDFQRAFQAEVMTKQFAGPFKKSYRASTSDIYQIVRQKFSKGNNFSYLTALIVLCHSFNQLMNCNEEELRGLFSGYVTGSKREGRPVEFRDLKIWMSKSSKQQITLIIKNVLSAFFG